MPAACRSRAGHRGRLDDVSAPAPAGQRHGVTPEVTVAWWRGASRASDQEAGTDGQTVTRQVTP
jgi:hypothetical protein